jgi:hypothetical protein
LAHGFATTHGRSLSEEIMNRIIKQVLLLLALAAGLQVSSLQANPKEREAILAVVEKAFAAVHSQNPDDWRAIQLAEGSVLTFRPDPAGEPGKLQLRMSGNEEFIAGMQKTEQDYAEYWTEEPTVLIRGPIAVVWGAFEFTVDGNFSHCGINSFDMVKIDEEWKIANVMWTTEHDNCPAAAGS